MDRFLLRRMCACRINASGGVAENQLDRIKEYAARRGMAIVRAIPQMRGKSGLSVEGRREPARNDRGEGRRWAGGFQSHPRPVMSSLMGPVSGCRRIRLLRIHLQASRSRRPLLRRTVRGDDGSPTSNVHQKCEALHGGRV